MKRHGPVLTLPMSRWIMIVLNLSGIDTKTFIGHSTRIVSSLKVKEAGVPTRGVLKCGFCSKKSTFENFTTKG